MTPEDGESGFHNGHNFRNQDAWSTNISIAENDRGLDIDKLNSEDRPPRTYH